MRDEGGTALRRALVFILACACCLPPSASGEPVSTSLTGRVTSRGVPAAGVTVTVTSPVLMHPRTATTGPAGTYWIAALPPGLYDVTFSRAGLTTLTRRAVLELARVARADAALEPSEDEESVTSTATTISVVDTTGITTHFPGAMLDRLPIRRDPASAAHLAPGSSSLQELVLLDGSRLASSERLGEEITREVTVIRGGLPAEFDASHGGIVVAATPSGGEDLDVALRGTTTDGDLLLESASGGRVIRERLWFFAGGWSGENDVDGFVLKLSAQPAPRASLSGEIVDAPEDDFASLRYTGIATERITIEALADRSSAERSAADVRTSFFVPGAAGDHVLVAGGSVFEASSRDSHALYLSDRFSRARWTLRAGLRYERGDEGDELAPRAALTYDLRGNLRHALVATHGEYDATRLTTLGYVVAIGGSGTARIDAMRREIASDVVHDVQLDARYRLFDQFELGANYAHDDRDANLWAGAELPVGGHRFGATVLQRWLHGSPSTDLALRYAIPLPRFTLTLATDIGDVVRLRVILRR